MQRNVAPNCTPTSATEEHTKVEISAETLASSNVVYIGMASSRSQSISTAPFGSTPSRNGRGKRGGHGGRRDERGRGRNGGGKGGRGRGRGNDVRRGSRGTRGRGQGWERGRRPGGQSSSGKVGAVQDSQERRTARNRFGRRLCSCCGSTCSKRRNFVVHTVTTVPPQQMQVQQPPGPSAASIPDELLGVVVDSRAGKFSGRGEVQPPVERFAVGNMTVEERQSPQEVGADNDRSSGIRGA